MEHREDSWQSAEGSGKNKRKRFYCGSGFPRPEPVEGQPRSCALKDFYEFNDLNCFNDFSDAYRKIKSKTQINANADTTPKIEDSTMT
jgi:hypothetical protein